MTERDALLRAVCEAPDDDTPRLVFADWLQENGDETRAEFIRLQCAFQSRYGITEGLPAEQPLRFRRMLDLRSRNRGRWLAELPTLGRRDAVVWQDFFHRGFVARLDVLDLSLLDRHAGSLMTATPVSHLGLRLRGNVGARPALDRLTTVPELSGVRFVSIDLRSIDGTQLPLEVEELERTRLYQRLSVLFYRPPVVTQSLVGRIQQLGQVALKHGHRVECL